MCAHCFPKQAGRLVTCLVKHSCEFLVSRPYSFSQNPILDELLVFIYLYQKEMSLLEPVGSTKNQKGWQTDTASLGMEEARRLTTTWFKKDFYWSQGLCRIQMGVILCV